MISDTVIFDKDMSNSNNGTPPSTSGPKTDKLKKAQKKKDQQKAPQKEKRAHRQSMVVPILGQTDISKSIVANLQNKVMMIDDSIIGGLQKVQLNDSNCITIELQ